MAYFSHFWLKISPEFLNKVSGGAVVISEGLSQTMMEGTSSKLPHVGFGKPRYHHPVDHSTGLLHVMEAGFPQNKPVKTECVREITQDSNYRLFITILKMKYFFRIL